MRHAFIVIGLAVFGLAAPCGSVLAQQDQPGEEQRRRETLERSQAELREQQRALAQSQRELQDRRQELGRARRELERSRRELEAAAREVARLSAVQITGEPGAPAGGRGAMLGAVITDAENGALVTRVSPGGPAADAGLEVGDIVLSADGTDLANGDGSSSESLLNHLRTIDPGETVSLVISRAGETQTIDVETREADTFLFFRGRPFDVSIPDVPVPGISIGGPRDFDVRVFSPFSSPWREMELVSLTDELGRYFGTGEGLLVVRAPDNDAIGLEDGDVILAIGGRTPSSPEHAMRILASFEAGETVEFSIMREQRRRSLEYEISEDD